MATMNRPDRRVTRSNQIITTNALGQGAGFAGLAAPIPPPRAGSSDAPRLWPGTTGPGERYGLCSSRRSSIWAERR